MSSEPARQTLQAGQPIAIGQTPRARIGALLLAAGESTRLGTPKQLLRDVHGRPLVSVVVHALQQAGCDPVVVVIGAHAEEVTLALIADAAAVFLVPHRGWSEGMGSSIRAGIATMSTHQLMTDVDAVLIAACDMPSADAAHFALLHTAALNPATALTVAAALNPAAALNAAAGHSGCARVASRYTTHDAATATRGIPAVFPRRDWPSLLALSGDQGAKALVAMPDTLTITLAAGSFDLDTPADVAAWRASATNP